MFSLVNVIHLEIQFSIFFLFIMFVVQISKIYSVNYSDAYLHKQPSCSLLVLFLMLSGGKGHTTEIYGICGIFMR